jgi:hypothetical protein
VLFRLAVLCIVVRLTLADSNTVLLAYYEPLRRGMMRPVLTGVETVLTGVDNGKSTMTIQTNCRVPQAGVEPNVEPDNYLHYRQAH